MAKRATAADKAKFEQIVQDELKRYNVGYAGRSKDKRLDGAAWISHEGKRIIQGSQPTTLEKTFILLHEIGHHKFRHTDKPESQRTDDAAEERETSRWAFDVLRKNGFDVRKLEQEEKDRIDSVYRDAKRVPFYLDEKAAMSAKKKKNPGRVDKFNFSKSNPSKKNLFGLGSKKTTYSTRLMREAYAAGLKSGDTDDLKPWIQKHDSKSLSRDAVEKLKDAYMAGVLSVGRVPREKGAKAVYEKEIFRQLANPKKSTPKKRNWTDRATGKKHPDFHNSRYFVVMKHDGSLAPGARHSDGFASRKQAQSFIKAERPNERNRFKIVKSRFARQNPKASARARRKPATAKRATKKAPTQKAAKKNPTIWNGHQGNVKAEVTKPLIGGKYTAKISRGSVVIQSKPFATAQGAISFARLRMHDRASNPAADLVPGGGTFMKTVDKTGSAWQKLAKRIKSQLVTRKKSNPVDTAVKAYEEFHGLPTQGVIEVREMEHRHEWTWLVGLLACIDVKLPNGQEVPLVSPGFSFSDPSRIERKKRRAGDSWIFNDRIAPDKVVLLTAVENGKQLLLKGGDQSLPLKELGFSERDERDHMVIGEIQEITYRTKKKFEDKGKTDTDFYHEFGKEGSGGVKPQLIYHPLSKHMQIVGGRYEVARPEKSLGNVSPGIIG